MEEKKSRKTLFSEMSRFFGSIAELITEQAKHETLKSVKTTSQNEKKAVLIENAKKIAESLQECKEELMRDFGAASLAFITKSIDPMLHQALFLVDELSNKKEGVGMGMGGETGSLYAKAIQSVGLYTQFSDEKKLIRKIVSDGIATTRLAIEKDCQILRHYQHHALQDAGDIDEAFMQALDKKIDPIFQELQELALTRTDSQSIRDFFVWKSHVDMRRSALLELGFLTVDSALSKQTTKKPVDEEEYEESDPHFLTVSEEVDAVQHLEEKAMKLYNILDATTAFSPQIFLQLEDLLANLKLEAGNYQKPHLEDSVNAIQKHIEKAAELLSKRQNPQNSPSQEPEPEYFS